MITNIIIEDAETLKIDQPVTFMPAQEQGTASPVSSRYKLSRPRKHRSSSGAARGRQWQR